MAEILCCTSSSNIGSDLFLPLEWLGSICLSVLLRVNVMSDGAAVTENESSENRSEENELSERNEPEINEYFSFDNHFQSGEPNSWNKIPRQ